MDRERDPNRRGEKIPSWQPSLRLRLSGWTIAVFSLTLAAFTAAGILEERRQLVRIEAEQGQALLAHLAEMPAFQSTLGSAASQLGPLLDLLRATGAAVELSPAAAGVAEQESARRAVGVLATRMISLEEGTFELRYRSDPRRFREATRRSVAIHIFHGLLALTALVAGTEWILRRRLLAPLARISHQVNHMRQGGGWLPSLPATDSELAGLSRAVRDLGPELEKQVHQWIEAERRAAVALWLNTLRSEVREPLRETRALVSDLQARDLVTPAGKQKLRALLAAADRCTRALTVLDRQAFAREWPPEADLPKGSPGEEISP
ncbi:MAG: hypothetical protein WEB59_06745 [Thermoanaerobaculia bacterium]